MGVNRDKDVRIEADELRAAVAADFEVMLKQMADRVEGLCGQACGHDGLPAIRGRGLRHRQRPDRSQVQNSSASLERQRHVMESTQRRNHGRPGLHRTKQHATHLLGPTTTTTYIPPEILGTPERKIVTEIA